MRRRLSSDVDKRWVGKPRESVPSDDTQGFYEELASYDVSTNTVSKDHVVGLIVGIFTKTKMFEIFSYH